MQQNFIVKIKFLTRKFTKNLMLREQHILQDALNKKNGEFKQLKDVKSKKILPMNNVYEIDDVYHASSIRSTQTNKFK
jgi:hypothetical protein